MLFVVVLASSYTVSLYIDYRGIWVMCGLDCIYFRFYAVAVFVECLDQCSQLVLDSLI